MEQKEWKPMGTVRVGKSKDVGVVLVKNATKDGYSPIKSGGVMDLSFPDSKTRRGRVIDGGETAPTLDTGCQIGVVQVAQMWGATECQK